MHTLAIETEGYGTIYVHHNSDWSGEAHINWHDPYDKVDKRVELPAVLLLILGKEAAADGLKNTLINAIENWPEAEEEEERLRR